MEGSWGASKAAEGAKFKAFSGDRDGPKNRTHRSRPVQGADLPTDRLWSLILRDDPLLLEASSRAGPSWILRIFEKDFGLTGYLS